MIKYRINSKRLTGLASQVNRLALIAIAVAILLPSAYAGTNNFTGVLDGTEPTSSLSYDFCGQGPSGPYDVIGPTRVSASGTYSFTDISIGFDIDIQLTIYSPSFDDSNPTNNRVPLADGYNGTNDVFDDFGTVELNQNATYFLVVQPLCNSLANVPGTWEFSLDGPGTFTGQATAIPTLSPTGLVIAGLLLIMAAFAALRRRKLV